MIGKIEVSSITEQEDGSVVYSFDMDERGSKTVAEEGLKLILYCGVTGTDIQDVYDWILAQRPHIRPFDDAEVKRAKERMDASSLKKCVSCKNPSKGDFCEFCIEEE